MASLPLERRTNRLAYKRESRGFLTRTHSPLCTSHQRSMPSLPPLSSNSPLGLQSMANTLPGASAKECRRSPLCASHRNNSSLPLLPPPLANRVPSGLHTTLATIPRCPCSLWSSAPSEAFHRRTLPFSPPLARRVPSGLQATRWITVGYALLTQRGVRAVTSHTSTPCR